LRERRSDILLLAQHFLHASAENGAPRKVLSPADAQRLMEHDWPGNVRELSNVIQRGDVFAPTRQIQASHIRNDTAIPDIEYDPKLPIFARRVRVRSSRSNARSSKIRCGRQVATLPGRRASRRRIAACLDG
jgi:DNA-binding NtrC family response regulator